MTMHCLGEDTDARQTCARANGDSGPLGAAAASGCCERGVGCRSSGGRIDGGAFANGDSDPLGAFASGGGCPGACPGPGSGPGTCCSAERAKPTEVCLAMRRAMLRMPTVRRRMAAVAVCVAVSAATRLTSPASSPYLEATFQDHSPARLEQSGKSQGTESIATAPGCNRSSVVVMQGVPNQPQGSQKAPCHLLHTNRTWQN
jgi:hypothetical protein